jgi:membrane protease YdiL (CAAX protease family)
VEKGSLTQILVDRRWVVVLVTGLLLIVIKRLIDWSEPLLPHVLLYLAVPIGLAVLLKFTWREIGLALPEDRRGWLLVAVLLAGAVVFAFVGTLFPRMMEHYPVPHWGPVEATAASLVPYESAIAVIMLATELLYRGWLVLALSERFGRWAVLISAIVYALAHIGKPPEEVVFSLAAGIVFGLADLEARSILPGFLSHFVGSAVFDLLALGS